MGWKFSEEAQLVLVHRDEHVLDLAVVVEHHLVRLTAVARLLVAAEGRVRRVGVVAVDPDAARLDRARHLVRLVRVARPDAGAQAVDGVVGDGDGLLPECDRCGSHQRGVDPSAGSHQHLDLSRSCFGTHKLLGRQSELVAA